MTQKKLEGRITALLGEYTKKKAQQIREPWVTWRSSHTRKSKLQSI
jgi:hypothetical protein